MKNYKKHTIDDTEIYTRRRPRSIFDPSVMNIIILVLIAGIAGLVAGVVSGLL